MIEKHVVTIFKLIESLNMWGIDFFPLDVSILILRSCILSLTFESLFVWLTESSFREGQKNSLLTSWDVRCHNQLSGCLIELCLIDPHR